MCVVLKVNRATYQDALCHTRIHTAHDRSGALGQPYITHEFCTSAHISDTTGALTPYPPPPTPKTPSAITHIRRQTLDASDASLILVFLAWEAFSRSVGVRAGIVLRMQTRTNPFALKKDVVYR